MNNKDATPKRVIYTTPGFPCHCEILGDELCNDLVVIAALMKAAERKRR